MAATLFLHAALAFVCVANAYAEPPTPVERERFEQIEARLEQHADQARSVRDALDSLRNEITAEKSCPAGAAFLSLVLKVRTRLVHWERDQDDESGSYSPSCKASVANRNKTMTCADNQIMLDTDKLAAGEDDEFGRLTNESLLYHELLHAQKMIDARNDPKWLSRVCNARNAFPQYAWGDDKKVDSDQPLAIEIHEQIRELQVRYTVDAAIAEKFEYRAFETKDATRSDGSFTIIRTLNELDLPENRSFYSFHDRNIDHVVCGWNPQTPNLVCNGKLRNEMKNGMFWIFLERPR